MSNELPEGWASARLDELCERIRGVSYARDEASAGPKPGCLPILRANNIESDRLRFDELVYVPTSRIDEAQRIHKGDVLIAMSSGSKSVVGKTAQALEDWDGAFGAFCGVLRPSLELSSRYFGLFLRTRDYRRRISDLAAGTNINNLKTEHFSEIEVPLAPLNEQRRIVAKLETLLGKVDACKQRLAKIRRLLKRFRQSVLAAACSGRLTADWRERNGGDSYESTTVEAIAEYVGGFAYKSPTFLKSGKHQVMRIGNVRPFALKLDASPVFIPEEIAEQTQRFKLLPGDIVISMTGTKYKQDYGFASLVSEADGSLFLNQRVARVRCGKSVLPKFLLFWFQSDLFREFFFSGETGNVNQGNVGASGIRNAAIELPPLVEQREIVRRVEQLFTFADQLEARFAKAQAHVDKLTQSLLAKAFRGELVLQDPNDEPASALLVRIRPEMSGAEKPARRKTKMVV